MYEQIIEMFSASEILSSVSNNIDMLASSIDGYLSGANNLRIASIILMLLAFVLFLFLIIIIYVKSLISFMKSDNKHAAGEQPEEDDILDDEDELRLSQILEDSEREKELEKELQKELELARIEKEMFEQKEQLEKQEKLEKQKKEEEQKKAEKSEKEERSKENKTPAQVIDLDWKKGKLRELDQTAPETEMPQEILSYHQTTKELPELLGLIIDMLSRGVDDLKIAQTVMFRNQGKNSEDDILQLIDAVKDFIGLCVNQHFDVMPNAEQLPSEEDALLHLAQGDPSPSLALLEGLMDYNIDRSTMAGADAKKDQLYQEISNQSCTFGTLASIHDVHLATGAFELAIELNPSNVNAWGRLADMYARAESDNKAIWAYQNVLKLADEDIYARQVANANKMMSQHLYAQGNSLQAAKLYNSSKQYYDSLGINRRPDKQEVEIIEIIEAHQKDDLTAAIQKLLNKGAIRAYSLA